MDVIQERYYKTNKILMTLIGLWPYQSRRASRILLGVVLFLHTSQSLPEMLAMVKYRNDPELLVACISPFIFVIVCLTKLITCMANSKKMLEMMNRIGENWRIWAGDREIGILHEYTETGRKLTIAYTVTIYSTGILYLTQPILPKIIDILLYNGTEPGEFPFPVYFPLIDQQKYYFYIIGFVYVCTSTNMVINIASDTILIVCVQHACGLFAALGHKLEWVGENEKLFNGRDMHFEYLATCIERHNDAIEFAKLIEATYSGCFFFVVGFNMIIISLTELQIITQSNEPRDSIRLIVFVGAQMIHLFILSYFSQILMDHSTSIRDHIHNGKWYKIPLKPQKLLNLMTMRCNEPCMLTAGKICVMSVPTFGAVVKTSMSYFTLLRSMQ